MGAEAKSAVTELVLANEELFEGPLGAKLKAGLVKRAEISDDLCDFLNELVKWECDYAQKKRRLVNQIEEVFKMHTLIISFKDAYRKRGYDRNRR